MAKMEPILKIWYDALRDDGKILGLKCKRCGAVQFPPVPVCNSCSCMETEWVEVDGACELVSFGYSPMGIAPYTQSPTYSGFVRLKDGTLFNGPIINISREDEVTVFESMPMPATLEIIAMDDTISFPGIRIL